MKKTVSEIAEHFDISRQTVYLWIKDGLKHEKRNQIGKKEHIVIDPEDVYEYKGIEK